MGTNVTKMAPRALLPDKIPQFKYMAPRRHFNSKWFRIAFHNTKEFKIAIISHSNWQINFAWLVMFGFESRPVEIKDGGGRTAKRGKVAGQRSGQVRYN